MRILFTTVCVYCLSMLSCLAQVQEKLTRYVNPFIGTGAVSGSLSGNTYPGATVPFGMVQLSPDTRAEPDWEIGSGYNYNDGFIAGFSHTHLSGTGAPDLYDVLIMPSTGAEKTRTGEPNQPLSGYGSRFSHSDETAKPGFYQVRLKDRDINVELTATAHAGFHKYTFPLGTRDPKVVIDLDHSMKKGVFNCRVIAAQLHIVNDHAIEGFRVISGWAKLRKVYFYAEFNRKIRRSDLFDGGDEYFDQTLLNGTDLRAVLNFDIPNNSPLLTKVGLSTVSIRNAKQNLSLEIPDWNFYGIAAKADAAWERELGKLKIDGEKQKKQIFYTALYHTFIQPNNYADVNGDYTGIDFTVHKASHGFYSTFSLWDTFRAAHPLYTLLQPERTTAFINNMITQYNDYGYLPIWQLWGQENYCMIGNHAIPVLVDAALKGLQGIDLKRVYQAVKGSATTDHRGSPFGLLNKIGYIPENRQSQSVSLTLEMAFDDWCVAQLAKKLNQKDDYLFFMKRSKSYRNLYDSESGFFRAKTDEGVWQKPFDPLKYGGNGDSPYTEGNAWQYFWYVPQDINDLINLTGGEKKFLAKLDTFFTYNQRGETNNNASGFIGQYAHGNEPSHHISYLYNYTSQPWKTQYYVAKICRELYNTSSSGYAGNEDCGQMSAWYVFSSLGFYPVNPASGVYLIGSPGIKKATIRLPLGRRFEIMTNWAEDKIYVQSVKLNNKPYTQSYITDKMIRSGGKLEFVMGSKPNLNWGIEPENKPTN
ncbi:GH92 family glycosyl hydrolase [Mucilaginibacter ginsenosidivorax]|uniref:Glycoside hydrolase family 92 protein n=1 Tax=Mucilaginibacter ginsenosidivorax TaxID=862126 RepID=A0A5B8W614_9SPHI|nr:GH92 family glycosyl hydrolase [Mucilaginibacter ginsenosidivorax]QEC78887.1 glycoside hydrolase family 92 protein [Mucilaginibacter ginsenosidivorax]